MRRNALYRIIGGLAVLAVVIGVYLNGKEPKPTDIELKIGEGGVSIQKN
ncbi:MAG: hypothetical protein AAAC47_27685 [Pararhizobium sp.]